MEDNQYNQMIVKKLKNNVIRFIDRENTLYNETPYIKGNFNFSKDMKGKGWFDDFTSGFSYGFNKPFDAVSSLITGDFSKMNEGGAKINIDELKLKEYQPVSYMSGQGESGAGLTGGIKKIRKPRIKKLKETIDENIKKAQIKVENIGAGDTGAGSTGGKKKKVINRKIPKKNFFMEGGLLFNNPIVEENKVPVQKHDYKLLERPIGGGVTGGLDLTQSKEHKMKKEKEPKMKKEKEPKMKKEKEPKIVKSSSSIMKRADIVKKIMKEKGLKMIDASRFVKENGLFKK